ncbi:unnamed protein product [Heterobilharzia americana]|nr:unnamed protein product [Heterobilharzia americana]
MWNYLGAVFSVATIDHSMYSLDDIMKACNQPWSMHDENLYIVHDVLNDSAENSYPERFTIMLVNNAYLPQRRNHDEIFSCVLMVQKPVLIQKITSLSRQYWSHSQLSPISEAKVSGKSYRCIHYEILQSKYT